MKICHLQDITQIKLSKLSCDDLIQLLGQVNELKGTLDSLSPILKESAITGKVLMYCDLNELKAVCIGISSKGSGVDLDATVVR